MESNGAEWDARRGGREGGGGMGSAPRTATRERWMARARRPGTGRISGGPAARRSLALQAVRGRSVASNATGWCDSSGDERTLLSPERVGKSSRGELRAAGGR